MLPHNVILIATFAGTTLAGCWFWYVVFSRHQSGKLNIPGEDRSAPARWGLLDVFGIGFLWMFAQASVVASAVYLTGIPADDLMKHPSVMTNISLGSGIAQLVCMAAAFGYLRIQYGYSNGNFGLAAGQNRSGLIAGFKGFVMWIPLVWLIQFLMIQFIDYKHPTIDSLGASPPPVEVLSLWFGAVIVAPIVEEFLFRGVLQGWIQRLGRPLDGETPESIFLGSRRRNGIASPLSEKGKAKPVHFAAIVVTSLVFALMHASQGPAPVALFVLSLGIGYLYQRTGSLLACVVMHMLLNFVTLTLISLETAGY